MQLKTKQIVTGNVCPTLTKNEVHAVICIEGNGSRPSHKGDGYKVSDVMYTLNCTEVHGVVTGVDLYNQSCTWGVSKTLNATSSDADHVPCVIIKENQW